MIELNNEIKALIIAGFINGYEAGHNDTVESAYTDAEERARDWFDDSEEDGSLKYTVEIMQSREI